MILDTEKHSSIYWDLMCALHTLARKAQYDKRQVGERSLLRMPNQFCSSSCLPPLGCQLCCMVA